MFLSFYTFIIILIVKVSDSVDVNEYQRFEPLKNKRSLQRLSHNVKQTAANKRASEFSDEVKLFENVQEESGCTSSVKVLRVENEKDGTLIELKTVLQKLLQKLNSIDKNKCKTAAECKITSEFKPALLAKASSVDLKTGKRNHNTLRRPRWGQWTPWSACSVSCGKGREIRWRHCMEECDNAETEMEEKTCQLPACSPGNFFGIHL